MEECQDCGHRQDRRNGVKPALIDAQYARLKVTEMLKSKGATQHCDWRKGE